MTVVSGGTIKNINSIFSININIKIKMMIIKSRQERYFQIFMMMLFIYLGPKIFPYVCLKIEDDFHLDAS